MQRNQKALLLLAAMAVVFVPAGGRAQGSAGRSQAETASGGSEGRASAAFERARRTGPLALHAFLERMPKGADLHMHLSGAIFAETFIKDAAEDGLCVDTTRLALLKNTGAQDAQHPQCPAGAVSARSLAPPATPAAQKLYDDLVDSLSMKTFVPASGTNGHDQFFSTFGRFSGLGERHAGEWLDEVATRAAAQNEQYLEVMQTPAFQHAATLGYQSGWPGRLIPATSAASSTPLAVEGTSRAELSALRDKLLAAGLKEEVAVDTAEYGKALAERATLEHCGTPNALPACAVEVKFIYQVLRSFPPQQVFAQTLLGFEVASADPDVVGINFVQPEDNYLAMAEYHRQMLMLDYLHSVYPKVHISLHAGELAPGLVPPNGLRFHIREAVELGHAERIGHGVDVMYETRPDDLLHEMAEKGIMVEINLTSNDVILGITAPEHPLPSYRTAKVPVSLSTDDEGVSRIDLTHEYVTAALTFGLNYIELKNMARTGLEHTFLPGSDLWASPGVFTRMKGGCVGHAASSGCDAFLKANPHAAQQWELERRFGAFEGEQHAPAAPR